MATDTAATVTRCGPAGEESARGTHVMEAHGRLPLDGATLARRLGLYLPDRLPIERWRRIGKQIFLIADAAPWWLGDWLVYGETEYGERYKEAVVETGLDYQTLRNYAWVARHVSMSRRRDKLSFQHHAEVAALCEDEQEVWLDKAEIYHWSRNELRHQLRDSRCAEDARRKAIAAVVLRINVPPEREQRWHEAADRMHRSLEDWMASVLDQAAVAVLEEGAEDTAPIFPAIRPPTR